MHSAALISLLPALAVAAPLTSRSGPSTSPLPSQQTFTMIARETPGFNATFSVSGLAVAAAHSGAGTATAVLVNATSNALNLTPFRFYQNGTASDVAAGNGQITGDVGQDPLRSPYGFVINTVTPHAVAINMVNYGTKSVGVVGVDSDGHGTPLVNVNRWEGDQTDVSVFYACQGDIFGQTTPELLWRKQGEATPEGCVELALLPQCAGDATITSGTEFVQNTPCYPTVEA